METFGKIMAGIIIIITLAIISGFVLMKLWLWFATGIFGLKPITLMQAMGLSLLVRYFTYTHSEKTDDDSFIYTIAKTVVLNLIVAVLFLSFGWIIHLLM